MNDDELLKMDVPDIGKKVVSIPVEQVMEAMESLELELKEMYLAISIPLEDAINRVRNLHKDDEGYCSGCCIAEDNPNQPGLAAPSVYPCPTIKALEGIEE